MCKHHASTGSTINDDINNNSTLEDMATSNITTITTVISIIVTTVNRARDTLCLKPQVL